MSCNKCNQSTCCCTDPSRYKGVAVDCLGITNGEVYDSVIEKMATEICSLVENYSGILYVDHVSFTSSTGTPSNVPLQPGETDTYTLWLNVSETESVGTFNVYNGANGQDIDHVSFTSSTGGGGAGQQGETDTYTVWGDLAETINLGTFVVYNGADGVDAEAVGLYSEIAGAPDIVNTTTETTLQDTASGSLLIPANTMAEGDVFQLQAFGEINVGSATDLTLRLKSAGVEIGGTGPISISSVTTKKWVLDVIVTIRAVGATGTASISGTFAFHGDTVGSYESYAISNIFNPFNTTISRVFDLTAQWSVADITNSIDSQTLILTKLK